MTILLYEKKLKIINNKKRRELYLPFMLFLSNYDR